MTDFAEFRASLTGPEAPAGLSVALQALWHQGKGDWDKAHDTLQADETGRDSAWVHAHLHRVEGDLGNAGYWYRLANKPVASGALDTEWEAIARALLGAG